MIAGLLPVIKFEGFIVVRGVGALEANIFANSTCPAFSATLRGVRPIASGWYGLAPYLVENI